MTLGRLASSTGAVASCKINSNVNRTLANPCRARSLLQQIIIRWRWWESATLNVLQLVQLLNCDIRVTTPFVHEEWIREVHGACLFVPLVMSCTIGAGPTATISFKRLAAHAGTEAPLHIQHCDGTSLTSPQFCSPMVIHHMHASEVWGLPFIKFKFDLGVAGQPRNVQGQVEHD